jgi:hypothetical protein
LFGKTNRQISLPIPDSVHRGPKRRENAKLDGRQSSSLNLLAITDFCEPGDFFQNRRLLMPPQEGLDLRIAVR